MMTWLASIVGFARNVPPAFALKAVAVALVFVLGLTIGNHWATERALQRELQASADRQRENHKQLLAWKLDEEKKLKADYDQQRNADRIAYNTLQDAKAESDAGKSAAERRLALAFADAAKLRMTNDGLKKVNDMLAAAESSARMAAGAAASDAGCVMPPGVRQAIDGYIASVNSNPFVGNPLSETTGLPLGPVAPDSVLTCRELAASVIDIIEHDAEQVGLNSSWRVWAEEALK